MKNKIKVEHLKNGDVFYFKKGDNIKPIVFNDKLTTYKQAKIFIRKCNFIKRRNKVIYQKYVLFKLEQVKRDDIIVTFDNIRIPVMYINDLKLFHNDIKKIIRNGCILAKRKSYKVNLEYNHRYHV